MSATTQAQLSDPLRDALRAAVSLDEDDRRFAQLERGQHRPGSRDLTASQLRKLERLGLVVVREELAGVVDSARLTDAGIALARTLHA